MSEAESEPVKPVGKRSKSIASPDPAALLDDCQSALQYRFRDESFLKAALTHASCSDTRVASNERLEFLGDAVLGMVICEHLFHRHPTLQEGELTKIKSVVVSRRACARISKSLQMERFMFLGRGMSKQGAIPPSVLADVFESLIAAIYLDGGVVAASGFILRMMGDELDKAANGHHGGNFKSILQQLAQKEFGATPTYKTLQEEGPDHSKRFHVVACIGKHQYPPAWGRNKKEAEQEAARVALAQIQGKSPPTDDAAAMEPTDGG